MRRSSQRARSGRQWQVSAGSFIQLEGIKTSDCLSSKRNSGTSGKALGLSVSRTRLVSHSSKLGSGVSCSARRVGSASFVTLSQQARLLRGHGTRFSLLPSCVKTQYRPREQLAGPRLSLPVWVEAFGITAEGHVRETLNAVSFTSWEILIRRFGARRVQDAGVGCQGARRGLSVVWRHRVGPRDGKTLQCLWDRPRVC